MASSWQPLRCCSIHVGHSRTFSGFIPSRLVFGVDGVVGSRCCLYETKYNPNRQAVFFYNDIYEIPPEQRCGGPIEKYRLAREELQRKLIPTSLASFDVSPLATMDELCLTHDEGYVHRYLHGKFTEDEKSKVGFDWSLESVVRSLSSAGGTVAAARLALSPGGPRFAGHVAGGTHHAFRSGATGGVDRSGRVAPDSMFNDIAMAANVALREHAWLKRILIIDLDVHQADGSAVLFKDDERVFTFSMQCRQNVFVEEHLSDLDIWVEQGTSDDDYMAQLERYLLPVFAKVKPKLVIFQAGVNCSKDDGLGKLLLTRKGLSRRNRFVYDLALAHDSRLVVTMGGGWPKDLDPTSGPFNDIVNLHVDAFTQAAEVVADASPFLSREGSVHFAT